MRVTRARAIRIAALAALFAGCAPADEPAPEGAGPGMEASTPAADLAAEEQRIRELDEQFVAAAQAGDVEAIRNLYATDGMIAPPNAPQAEGRAAVGEAWQTLLQAPGLQLQFQPTRIEVASAGDMAYDIGTYQLTTEGPEGPVSDEGKYVVVWVKEDGDWKVAADIFNSDLPAPE